MMCGEWHLGFWLFPLWYSLPKKQHAACRRSGNLYECAFCAAVPTEKQAGRGWISPSPLGRLTGAFSKIRCTVSKSLRLIIGSCTFFCDVPLAPIYIVVMFIPEMLCSLEVDYIAAGYSCRVRKWERGGFFPQRLSHWGRFYRVFPPRSFM